MSSYLQKNKIYKYQDGGFGYGTYTANPDASGAVVFTNQYYNPMVLINENYNNFSQIAVTIRGNQVRGNQVRGNHDLTCVL